MRATPAPPTALESALRRERLQYLVGPVIVALLSWAWLVPAALDMYGEMSGLSAWMMQPHWSLHYGVLIFAMWTVMMAAMMLPSLAPALLLYGGICRSDTHGGAPALRVHLFALGYLGAWASFSAAATLLQWQLSAHGLLSMMMQLSDQRLSATVLILAGLYQWTPLKQNCLRRCRSPAEFISNHWRRGPAGAVSLGFSYGLYCLGCCWALMLLLFACGVMHLGFIALLSLLVLVEKATPRGLAAARACGAVLLGLGGWVLYTGA